MSARGVALLVPRALTPMFSLDPCCLPKGKNEGWHGGRAAGPVA